MNRLKLFIPLIVFAVMAILFLAVVRGVGTGDYSPTALPSALVDRPLPDFELADLKSGQVLRRDDLLGKPFLLNVWATWCPTCHYEHPYLLKIAERDDVVLYGIDYKDNRARALQWLQEKGDPYRYTLFDADGRLGLDLGVTGAPETYLVDAKGIVRFRYQGAVDDAVWQKHFEPRLTQLRAERG